MTQVTPETRSSGGGESGPERKGKLPAEFRERARRERDAHRAAESRWAWARLFTFLAAVLAWFLPGGSVLWSAVLCGALLVSFGLSVGRHRRRKSRRELAERLLEMIDEAERRCGGRVMLIRSWQRPEPPAEPDAEWGSILECGRTWPITEQEVEDLDLYSQPVGVFGLLNRCSTRLGVRRLSEMLETPMLSAERIRERQDAVRWLDQHPIERMRMMAGAAVLRGRDDSLDRLVAAVRRAQPLPAAMLSGPMRLWAIPSGLIVLVCLAGIAVAKFELVFVFLALLLVNGALFERVRRELAARLEPWRNLVPAVTGYLGAARQAAADLPAATELGGLAEHLGAAGRPSALPALCNRVAWTDAGGMFHALANALFFYDLHVAEAVLAVVVPHKAALLKGLSALADTEALLSLGTFAWEQPAACYPRVTTEPGVAVSGGRHPLIVPEQVVPNDVHLSPECHLWMITGSNMAGKSTLLRMVGVNVLLAQMGTTAAAEEMVFCPVRLISDLRVRDSLAEQESYFLAEVRHLRRMILPQAGESPVLGLIDEPFRGTNSEEQVAASLAVVQYLLDSPHFFLVSTHEARLTGLAEGPGAENHHFRENLSRDGLVFDYRLHTGPAQTRNALLILEREGYPDEIVGRAREWIDSAGAARPPSAG